MARDFNTNTSNNDEWLTPPDMVAALGPFDLDPCSPVNRPWPTAAHHFTVLDNGLLQPWQGRVWLNPPYGRETFRWLERLAEHRRGLALIFARTETVGFHKTVWEKAHSVFFFKGRIRFHTSDGEPAAAGGANAPSCLVSYSPNDTAAIIRAIQAQAVVGHIVFPQVQGVYRAD